MRPLWIYGFRPFFLLAALYGAIAVVTWTLTLRGVLPTSSSLPPLSWHAHEMLFGFTAAVIAGFLLTAVRNWTGGARTLEGGSLMALVAVWVLSRVIALAPFAVPAVHLVVDAAFFVGLATAIGVPLFKARSRRNLLLPPLVLLLGGADVAMHLGALGVGSLWLPLGTVVGLHVPMIFLVVIGGRVIPFFTRNALQHEGVEVRDLTAVAYASLVAVAVATIAEVAVVVTPTVSPVAVVANATAGVLLLVRMRHWRTARTLTKPVLAVLHVGWAFLGLGYLLLALSRAWPSLLAPTTALHGLTVGALALIILGMMSRVSLGHTGRPIVVKRIVVVAYGLLALAALVRVAGPALADAVPIPFLDVSAALFAASFVIFFVVYLPVLVSPRADEEEPTRGTQGLRMSPGPTAK